MSTPQIYALQSAMNHFAEYHPLTCKRLVQVCKELHAYSFVLKEFKEKVKKISDNVKHIASVVSNMKIVVPNDLRVMPYGVEGSLETPMALNSASLLSMIVHSNRSVVSWRNAFTLPLGTQYYISLSRHGDMYHSITTNKDTECVFKLGSNYAIPLKFEKGVEKILNIPISMFVDHRLVFDEPCGILVKEFLIPTDDRKKIQYEALEMIFEGHKLFFSGGSVKVEKLD